MLYGLVWQLDTCLCFHLLKKAQLDYLCFVLNFKQKIKIDNHMVSIDGHSGGGCLCRWTNQGITIFLSKGNAAFFKWTLFFHHCIQRLNWIKNIKTDQHSYQRSFLYTKENKTTIKTQILLDPCGIQLKLCTFTLYIKKWSSFCWLLNSKPWMFHKIKNQKRPYNSI